MSAIKITALAHDTGNTTFLVSGTVAGKQRKQRVKTNLEAMTLKQNWEREQAGAAPLPAITTRLTTEQAEQAETAFRKLAGNGLALDFCVDFTLANFKPGAVRVKVTAAYEKFMAAKQERNRRTDTTRNLRLRLAWLVREHGTRFVDEVTDAALGAWIFRAGSEARNQVNDTAALTNFFNFCVKKKFLAVSPLDALERVTVDDTEPEAMTLAQVRRLLAQARTFKNGKLVAYTVLALFCAIRPKEIERLTWDNVNLADGVVTITGAIAKKRSRRTVAISQNALEWLQSPALGQAPFVGPNWRKDWDELRGLAGFKVDGAKDGDRWVPDFLRHTGISMHLAHGQDDAKTALWAGNSPGVIHAKYKGLVSSRDVTEFWSITPANVETQTVDLKAHAA